MADILLVDDEPEIMATTKIVLERAGYRVIEAESGAECLEKLKKKQPDLILLDVMLPDESGWDVCRKIKKYGKTRDIPVVMFTVRTSEDSVEKSLKCADAQIGKPFRIEYLLKTIKRLLDK